jgi:transposase-like protein
MNRRKEIKEGIVAEYLAGETTYRELSEKYGYSLGTIHRWVKEAVRKRPVNRGGGDPEEEIKQLRAELRRSELHNKLLNAMIDIAEGDLGVSIRKKRGPKQ